MKSENDDYSALLGQVCSLIGTHTTFSFVNNDPPIIFKFPKNDPVVIAELTRPDIYQKLDPKNPINFFSMSKSGTLRLPSVICYLPIWSTLMRGRRIPANEDGHVWATLLSLQSTPNDQILFFENDSHPKHSLAKKVSQWDYYPKEIASISCALENILSQNSLSQDHAIQPAFYSPTTNQFEITTTNEKHRSNIRENLTILFEEAYTIGRLIRNESRVLALDQTAPSSYLHLYHRLTILLGNYETLKENYKVSNGRFFDSELYRSIKVGLSELTKEFSVPRLNTVNFLPESTKGENKQEELSRLFRLDHILKPYRYVASQIKKAHDAFAKANNGDLSELASGIEDYEIFLKLTPRHQWRSYASGKGPLVAIGQLSISLLFHLLQDSTSHCAQWNQNKKPKFCQQYVFMNLAGKGEPQHSNNFDATHFSDGTIKPSTLLAIQMVQEANQILQISNEEEFEGKLKKFLDEYYPN